MNADEQNRFQLVDAIRSRNVSQENLDSLIHIVTQNGSPQLVDDLICKEKAAGRNEDDAVSETMLHLESLGDTVPFLACVFMAHLSPIAGRLLLHDISDGIALWIAEFPSDELARQLRLIAASQTHPRAKKSMKGWQSSLKMLKKENPRPPTALREFELVAPIRCSNRKGLVRA
jgi:hypothetical protein